LDGVFAMQGYYAAGGFVFSHRDMRFRAEIPVRPATSLANYKGIIRWPPFHSIRFSITTARASPRCARPS